MRHSSKSTRSAGDRADLRIAHLEMIQGVISRMSGFSATAKNFAVTVSAASFAVAFDKQTSSLLWAGGVAVVAFLLMDGYYHLLEVRFRDLYIMTARRPLEAGSDMLLNPPRVTRANWRKALLSATLLPFYVSLLFALLVALYAANYDYPNKTVATAARDPAGASAQIDSTAQRVGRSTQPTLTGEEHVGRSLQPAQAGNKHPGDVR